MFTPEEGRMAGKWCLTEICDFYSFSFQVFTIFNAFNVEIFVRKILPDGLTFLPFG